METPPLSAKAAAIELVRRLQSAGYVAYFAGGCVRDRLMNRIPNDFDVATSARPEQVLALFPHAKKVGVAFGVVLVRPARQAPEIEVATFRSDGAYHDGRHPDHVSFTTPQHDAQRRDFSCNGLFFDPLANQLHDYVGGQADIASKTLRAIGDPQQRFAEDHLRMLRAVRFAAKLDFVIESQTAGAIAQMADQIITISRERIGEELRLMLEHPARVAAIRMLQSTGDFLLQEIWPARLYNPAEFSFAFLAALAEPVTRPLALASIQLSMSRDARPASAARLLREAFVLSNDETTEIAWLLEKSTLLPKVPTLTKAQAKRLLAGPYFPHLWQLQRNMLVPSVAAAVEGCIATLQAEGIAPPPLVTGEDLTKLGASPGPAYKRWLEQLYDRQLELEFPSRLEALDAARRFIAESRR